MIPGYRFISPIKTPCRCPQMSWLWLLIRSPHFSAWLINKCPCNFAQLVSHSSHRLNEKKKKTYSVLIHIRWNSDTSSGGIDHSHSPLQRCMPMTSIIRPPRLMACALQTSTAVINPPPSSYKYHPLSSSCYFALPPFCPPSLLWYITYIQSSAPFSPTFPPVFISSFQCPLFPYISVPSSFPPVIRS